jgi:hypothetical protein
MDLPILSNINNGGFQVFKIITNIVYAVVMASSLIIATTTEINGQNALVGLMSGYGSILASILLLLAWLFKYTTGTSYLSKLILMAPFMLIISFIILIMIYLSVYFKRISKKDIPKSYYTFSRLSYLFIISQIFIILSYITGDAFSSLKTFGNKTFSILMLMATLNAIWVIYLGVILKFYTADG